MEKRRYKQGLLVFFGLIILVASCSAPYFRSVYTNQTEFLYNAPNLQGTHFLKAHLRNGDVVVYTAQWDIVDSGNAVNGQGQRYDFNRRTIRRGLMHVDIDSVALFETNQKIEHPEGERLLALGLMTGVDVIVGVICITNPKSCFGSCPTFYLQPDHPFHFAHAEGFSNAIAPSLEYTDADALGLVKPNKGRITLYMKNEALETHCVRSVKLGVVPKIAGEHVYHGTDDRFWRSTWSKEVSSAKSVSGDVSDLLRTADQREYFSTSDPLSLEHKEQVILEFPPAPRGDSLALLLDFRQSLMTTYLIYNALAYMGDQAGDYLAQLERDSVFNRSVARGIHSRLGGIDVELEDPNSKRWIPCGSFDETGPIAINRQVLPLNFKSDHRSVRLRLTLNSGMWRIDRAQLVNTTGTITPLIQEPVAVRNKGRNDSLALNRLLDPRRHLISMPGSAYAIDFAVPDSTMSYTTFLYSTGYYLEWMRASWLAEKNPAKLRQLIQHPSDYFRAEAHAYKTYEHTMEEAFWKSRIDTRNFSYHEE
jgi:hypothetical protein